MKRYFILLIILRVNFVYAQITTFPYHLGFESNFPVNWFPISSVPDCSTEWYISSTPENANTGAATAQEGTQYLTTSYTGCSEVDKLIVSPDYNFTGLSAPTISFYFHMYGANIGTLSLEVSIDEGFTWSSPVWQRIGAQQNAATDPWLFEEVDLSSYVGQTLALRFKATNAGELSAFSLDQFRVFDADNDVINGVADVFYEYDAAGNRVKRYYEVMELDDFIEDPTAQARTSSSETNVHYLVYPNPSTYHIHVESKDVTESSIVRLLDFNRRIVKTLQMNDGFVQIDMSTLQVGTYFITIQNGAEVVTKKVLKL